jgi:predicted Zn finger-like uncharacterized protein
MSLLTSCPACGTVFKIKPEQLAPSRGDVRCGKCGEIFNALQSLSVNQKQQLTEDLLREAPASEADTPAWAVPEEETVNAAATDADDVEPSSPEAEPDQAQDEVMLDFNIPFDIEETPPEPAQKAAVVPEALPQPAPPQSQPQPQPEPEPEPERSSMASPSPVNTMAGTSLVVQKAALKKKRRGPVVWYWVVASALALLLLLAQTLFLLRSQIALVLPQTKPTLEQLCAALGCKVELPRNAQLLSIDESDLQEHPDHKDVFLLTAVIVNRAPYPQAYPLLEVTLTDLRDAAVMRRTLQPQEYLPPGIAIDKGLGAQSDARIKLAFTAPGIAATGYRVFVRYP